MGFSCFSCPLYFLRTCFLRSPPPHPTAWPISPDLQKMPDVPGRFRSRVFRAFFGFSLFTFRLFHRFFPCLPFFPLFESFLKILSRPFFVLVVKATVFVGCSDARSRHVQRSRSWLRFSPPPRGREDRLHSCCDPVRFFQSKRYPSPPFSLLSARELSFQYRGPGHATRFAFQQPFPCHFVEPDGSLAPTSCLKSKIVPAGVTRPSLATGDVEGLLFCSFLVTLTFFHPE